MNEIQWRIQVYLCRRFLKNMTVEKMGVLCEVTGLPLATIATIHPACRELKPPVTHRLAA